MIEAKRETWAQQKIGHFFESGLDLIRNLGIARKFLEIRPNQLVWQKKESATFFPKNLSLRIPTLVEATKKSWKKKLGPLRIDLFFAKNPKLQFESMRR